ncbi:bacillithiol system redox-active protein YtxJ [Caldibacillus lycopersici]|uniref:Bacillithiol system redox-active protein YtxJ n=1 Tax=Perspicuibacillus lycopersici TaxID=1325689 RepID=A0AAE3IY82_9BACI|nr:bacillithiol system redox-active protein YtxJ [Perspicuibacillus lycopersici]MCU9614235.1 bacillithiol system redox-active protein YtxJ [Perspicuibacillus lycopersici]
MSLKKVSEENEFQSILANEGAFLFFKHSLTCPISAGAYEAYQAYLADHPNVPAYYLAVQESRPLSNYIAEYFAVKHESPQIFYIVDGQVKWHTSHQKITKEKLEEVVE